MNQIETVLNHLTTRGPITPREAIELYGILRLGARIYDLKQMGFVIQRQLVEDTNRYGNTVRYARYSLIQAEGKEQ